MLFWVGVSDIPGGTDGEQGQQRADVLSVIVSMNPSDPNLRQIYRRNSNISVNMNSGKKTALTKLILIFAAAVTVVTVCCSAGCVISPEGPETWTPEITQLTDYPEYNLYLAEYTHDDKLDELIAEHIADTFFPLMEASMKRLYGDVSWLIDKFDYRYKDADWGNSREALQNCMQKLKGGYPADPVYKQQKKPSAPPVK